MRYTTIVHTNSRNAHRRGLNMRTDKLGQRVFVDVFSNQIVRGGLEDLPHQHTHAFLRGFRSKYGRHVGAKQLAKKGVR